MAEKCLHISASRCELDDVIPNSDDLTMGVVIPNAVLQYSILATFISTNELCEYMSEKSIPKLVCNLFRITRFHFGF